MTDRDDHGAGARGRRSRRWIVPAAAVLGSGLALAFVLAQAEGLWAPGGPLEGAGRLAYRAAFWVTLPAEAAARRALPRRGPLRTLEPLVVGVTTAAALFGLVALRRLARRRAPAGAAAPPTAPSRRAAIGQLASGAAGAATLGLGGWSTFVEPCRVRTREYEIPVAGLPGWADGLRILHVTDTHYGPFVSLRYLESVVERANALEPDLVVLTGDYVHRTPRAIEPGVALLCGLRGRLGRAAVLGNHDHWEGAAACRAAFRRGGVVMLDNDRRFLTPAGIVGEPRLGAICLAGLGDLWEEPGDPSLVLRSVPAAMPRLLLSHNPDAAELVRPGTRVDLVLSGHTHGGQVRLPGLGSPVVPSRYGERYASGLCRGPGFPVVVSAGVGLAVLPLRLGARPDVGLVTLRARPR